MKSLHCLLHLALAVSTQGCIAQSLNSPAKFSVLVLDEQNRRPVEGALVEAGFERSIGHEPAVGVKALTPTNGLVSFENQSSSPPSFAVSKKGYRSDIDRDLMVNLRVVGPLAGLLPLKTDLRHGSELKTPHQALPDGYESEHPIWSFVGTTNVERFTRQNFQPASSTQSYLFRIRTEVDEQGRLKKAYYGKILGEIEALHGGVDNVLFRMTYFINPTANDRNIEHDYEKLVPVGSPGAVLK